MLSSDLQSEVFCSHLTVRLGDHVHVYMRYELAGSGTTYLIFHSPDSSIIGAIKQRLSSLWKDPAQNECVEPGYPDVFMLHCMILTEHMLSNRNFLTGCWNQLIFLLNKIDTYIEDTSRRENLKKFTIGLNKIAQYLDIHTFRLDETFSTMNTLSKSHDLLQTAACSSSRSGSAFSLVETINRLRMMLEQHRSYLSYVKSRRETAMNLVSTS